MQKQVILFVVDQLLNFIPPSSLPALIDDGIDLLEDRFKDKPVLMRVVNWARLALRVPDNEGGDQD